MTCEVCGHTDKSAIDMAEDFALIMEHFRVMHPDLYDKAERWPDGEFVVHDTTLEPSDFADGAA